MTPPLSACCQAPPHIIWDHGTEITTSLCEKCKEHSTFIPASSPAPEETVKQYSGTSLDFPITKALSSAPKQETAKSEEWWEDEIDKCWNEDGDACSVFDDVEFFNVAFPKILAEASRRAKEEERARYAKIIQNQIGLLDRLDGVYVQPPAKDVLKSILSALTSETEV